MSKLTPAQAREKHNRRLKASIEDMRIGVEGVTESPTAKAAASQAKMLAEITRSINSGKWAAGLKRVTLDDWKTAMLDKGLGRVAAGIDAAGPKVEAFFNELFPHIDAGQAALKKMPDVTLEDSIARMTFMVRHMHKFTRKL